MKRIFYTLFLFLPFTANSQITITSSDMPDVSISNINDVDTYRLSVINGPDSIDLTNTGAGWSWDYSFLQPDEQKVDTFVNPLNTDYQYYFNFNNCFFDPEHCASYAQPIAPPPSFDANFQLEDVYYYYKETSSEYTQVGFGAKLNGISISQQYNPVDVIYEFPLNFGNTSTSTSSFNYDFPNNDDYYGRKTTRNNTVDGWGTLTTPFGTFQTLRVRAELLITDTFYSDTFNIGFTLPRPTQYEYKWLAKNEGVPVLQINAQKAGNNEVINGFVYRDSVRIDLVNVEKVSQDKSEIVVYPNPAGGKFCVSGLSLRNSELIIYNMLGEIVNRIIITDNQVPVSIDLSPQPSGIYFLQINSRVHKLVINH